MHWSGSLRAIIRMMNMKKETQRKTEINAGETRHAYQDAALQFSTQKQGRSTLMMLKACPKRYAKTSRTRRSAKSLTMRLWFSTPSQSLVWSLSDFWFTVSLHIARRKEKWLDSSLSLRKLSNSFRSTKMFNQIWWQNPCSSLIKLRRVIYRSNDEQYDRQVMQ